MKVTHFKVTYFHRKLEQIISLALFKATRPHFSQKKLSD